MLSWLDLYYRKYADDEVGKFPSHPKGIAFNTLYCSHFDNHKYYDNLFNHRERLDFVYSSLFFSCVKYNPEILLEILVLVVPYSNGECLP